MGYAPKGILRGRVAVPIRDRAGVLLAYCGIATTPEHSPRFLFPSNFDPASAIFNADRIAEGELNLLANIVQVLEAFQNGIENTVCFLTEGVTAAAAGAAQSWLRLSGQISANDKWRPAGFAVSAA